MCSVTKLEIEIDILHCQIVLISSVRSSVVLVRGEFCNSPWEDKTYN